MRWSICVAALSAAVFTFGCSKGNAASGSGGTGRYAAVQSIFNANCMPCHSAEHHKGSVDLSSYDAAVNSGKEKVIKPGDPAGSTLVQQVSGSSPAMPQGRSPLSSSDVQTISDWIKAGATNG